MKVGVTGCVGAEKTVVIQVQLSIQLPEIRTERQVDGFIKNCPTPTYHERDQSQIAGGIGKAEPALSSLLIITQIKRTASGSYMRTGLGTRVIQHIFADGRDDVEDKQNDQAETPHKDIDKGDKHFTKQGSAFISRNISTIQTSPNQDNFYKITRITRTDKTPCEQFAG
ncbi:unnamed protein product [Clavelina lepadiformis]|uniref:Uncharacterized protein n=1 Tax=Clavelina lepadiformis TaxID=159417 RepID=A0ABP0GRS6_CLALP